MLSGNRTAIIIGINDYKDNESIPQLLGAENDAKEIYNILSNPNIGNFIIPKDHFLLSSEATCENIRKAVSRVLWKAQEYDLVLFYFSGHGFVDGYGNGYIAPHDMLKNEPFVYGINMEELKDIISNSLNKKTVLMIIDCCYSGILTKGDDKLSFERNLDMNGEGRITLASSEADRVSRENMYCKHSEEDKDHPHGVFTSYLIDGLYGKGDKNGDGIIGFDELLRYIEEQMESKNKQKPKFSARETTKIDDIKIAVAEKRYKEYVNQLVKQVENYCSSGGLASLKNSVLTVDKIKSIESQNENIPQLNDLIDRSLTALREPMRKWLLGNLDTVRNEWDTSPRRLYVKMLHNIDSLSLDSINNIDKRDLSLYQLISTYTEEAYDDITRTGSDKLELFKTNFIARYNELYNIGSQFGKQQTVQLLSDKPKDLAEGPDSSEKPKDIAQGLRK